MSYKYINIVYLTLPLILANISIPLVGIADTAIAGHYLGISSIAAIGLGAIVFDIIYWSFSFLKLATSGMVSQSLGKEDYASIDISFYRHILLALLIASIAVLCGPLINQVAIALLQPGLEIIIQTQEYISSRIFSAPAVFLNYVMLGYFIANRKMFSILVYTLILNGSNILLNFVFVAWLNHGIEGIAIASVISQYVALCTFIIILFFSDSLYLPKLNFTLASLWNPSALRKLFTTNSDIFLRTLSLLFVFFYIAKLGAGLGTVVLAANVILLHFQSTMAYALDAFSDVAESLSGRAFGQKNKLAFTGVVTKIFHCMSFYAVFVSIIFYYFSASLIYLFSNDVALLIEVQRYIPWLIISPVISYICFLMDGVFVGTLHTKEMRNAMLISTIVFILAAYLCIPIYQNHGLWLAFICFMLSRGITMSYYYYTNILNSKNWLRY